MNSGPASGGTAAAEVGGARSDAVAATRMAWAMRLIAIALSVAPLSSAAFTLLFHGLVSSWALLAWSCLLVATSLFSLVMSLRYRRGGADPTSMGYVAAVVLNAVVFSLPPWILGPVDAPGVALAVCFPAVALTLSVVIFAPVKLWFGVHQAIVATSSVVWALVDHGRLNGYTLAAAFCALALVTVVLHREANSLVNHAISVGARNSALVDRLHRDRADLEHANAALGEVNARLRWQATHDPLTGVLNRRGLEMRLAPYIEAARSADQRVYILFCDLDRFKQVNDTFGHAAGDRLLVTTAARIAEAIPDTAVLARFGGDEFVAVVTLPGDCTSADAVALVLSDRLRTAVAEPVEFEGTEFVVTTTVGVAPFPDDAPIDIDILRNADRALHYAKGAGRDRSQLFVDRADMVHPRVDDAHQLRTAIENGGIVPWYQPIVDAATGRIVGAELLARWIASDGRAVKASEFIDMAHDGGLVERLSEVLTTRALADLAYWKRVGLPPDFRLAVNLPPRFASKDARNDALLALLSSASAIHLVAEISEASVIDDLGVAARRIAELRQLGIEVVLDDFGTGSASLALLKRVPLDGIKIDRSFVEDIEFDPRDRSLVQNFTQLASELGLTVTGEGVERRSQAESLLELGVARQQGYLYGDAVDAVELVAKLHQPPRRPRATSAA